MAMGVYRRHLFWYNFFVKEIFKATYTHLDLNVELSMVFGIEQGTRPNFAHF